MKNKVGCMTLACFLWLVFLIIGWSCLLASKAHGSVTNWPATGQFLMADQHGNINPPGYAAGLSEIARAEAEAESVRIATELCHQTTEEAGKIVKDVVDALTGTYGFAYVTGYTVSFVGAVEVSTNAAATIVFCQFGQAGSMSTNGVNYTGHYIWHVYSDTMNTTPAIKYRRELNGTNAWEFVEYQSTAEFTQQTVNGTTYATVYRSTIWLPSTYNTAFFMAFCEIVGGGQAGGKLDIIDGFTVNGKAGFTGDITEHGFIKHFEGGLLMSVTAEGTP